ncbi:hypothetical protein [Sphingomonas natans]|nr:hypothetical protein [Sphingomonas sp. BIUV-7]
MSSLIPRASGPGRPSPASARLFALDAKTGARSAGFGDKGEVGLMTGMPNPKPRFYMVTSPPVIVADLAIFGAAIKRQRFVP